MYVLEVAMDIKRINYAMVDGGDVGINSKYTWK